MRSAATPSHAERAPGRPSPKGIAWVPTSASWWGGFGFLRFHCGLFLIGVPLLFLVNLILAPQRLWIDRFGLAWLALLVVHAAIVGIIRAVGVLREDAQPAPARETTAQPRSSWITARSAEPQDADFRIASPEPASDGGQAPSETPTLASWRQATPPAPPASLARPGPPAGSSVWDGWTAGRTPSSARTRSQRDAGPAPSSPVASPLPSSAKTGTGDTATPDAPIQPTAPAGEERVSWRKVAEAAWLTPPDDPSPIRPPDGPTKPAP